MIIKEQVIKKFNKGAETYDDAALLQTEVAEQLGQRLTNISATSILEIGCGTGLFSHQLLAQYPQANLLLVDIAPAMVEECRNWFLEFPKIQLECMDGEALNLKGSYDLIISCMTFHWFKNFEQSFKNFKQLLTQNGRIMFAMLGSNSLLEWRTICEKFQLPIGTPQFPTLEAITKNFPELKLQTEVIKQKYSSAHDFLKTLKALGATATQENYLSLSVKQLRKILRNFNNEIEISYQVIYGEYQHP